MSAKEALIKARSLVEQGWTQGAYHEFIDGKECYCVSGAIYAAADIKWHDETYARIAFAGAVGDYHIAAWNDRPGRTKAEVLAAFDKAIELAKD